MKNKIFKTLFVCFISICACLSFALFAGCGEDKGTVTEEESFIVGTWVCPNGYEYDYKWCWEFYNDNTAQDIDYKLNTGGGRKGYVHTWTYDKETKTISLTYDRGTKTKEFTIETEDSKYYFKDGSHKYYKE